MLWLLLFSINISCLCILEALCECDGVLYSQDVFAVDLPTIVPFYFTWSIWTVLGIAAVYLNRDDAHVQCDCDCHVLYCNVIVSWEGSSAAKGTQK